MNKPLYVNSAMLALELGVLRSAVANWLTRYEDFPAPDAYVVDPRATGGAAPLWLDSRIDDWQAWRDRRRPQRPTRAEALTRARETLASR